MEPLVSILIPAFNAERWIADAIQSAIGQTWTRKEIIVVDDGSTDQTGRSPGNLSRKAWQWSHKRIGAQQRQETRRFPLAAEILFNGWMPMISSIRTKLRNR